MFEGPATYIPCIEELVVTNVNAVVIKPDTAIRLEARRHMTDRNGIEREAGQQWLERKVGAYMPGVDEIIKEQCVQARVLTEKTALHVRATKSFTDIYNEKRKAGDEWLVTNEMAETHIPSVNEHIVGVVNITTLTNRQFCVVLNPYDADGTQKLGSWPYIICYGRLLYIICYVPLLPSRTRRTESNVTVLCRPP